MFFASKRAQRVVLATGLALGLLALGACSGGGGSVSNPLPQANQPTTPQGGTAQFALNAAGMSVALPSVAGFAETLTIPANNAAAGTNLTVRVTSLEPAGMPKLDPDMHVAIPFLYFTVGTNKDVKLNGFPGFKMTIPAGFTMGNMPVKVGWYDPVGGWRHVGDFTLSGRVATFTPTATPITLKANVTYIAITYTCGGPSPSPTPTGVLSCTASGTGAIAVLCIQGGSTSKTYAFAGKGLASSDTVEQIDISGGATGGGSHVVHTYTSSKDILYHACSGDEKHSRVFCSSFTSPDLMDINGLSETDTEFDSGATGVLNFSGTSGTGGCVICAVAFDPMDTAFILMDFDPKGTGCVFSNCGRFQRMGENSHTIDMNVSTTDPNENPGYDYVKNWIVSPLYYTNPSKFQVADFTSGKLYTSSAVSNMTQPDSACIDVATHVGDAGNEFNNVETLADLGTATLSGSTLAVTTGQTTLTHSNSEGLDLDACGTDSVIHVTFFAGEFSTNLMGFGLLPTTSTGTTISDWAFAKFPNTPDAAPWKSAFDPHPIAVFNDPINCPDCAISVNQGATWLAVIDLNKLTKATR
ncbi:MAG: hypothetical protein JOZ50_10065, partial [Candidatus Eremiobacteraeota bacterium]|nr:hypothetical protein [Candidatus Eremiobacteraeota bacterium]